MSSKDDVCPVCHDVADLFAIGQCDHPICFRCSTRMRIICDQMYCAICRTNIPKVLFVKTLSKFNNINTSAFLIERRAMIFCDTEDTQTRYRELLEHRCRVCKGNVTFQNFKQLEDHMRKEHHLFACKLCLKHIKLLSNDRKFYDRSSLARHNRIGDADDKSYKGHPSCQFCDERYADNDELLKHLRKDHYFCFICESSGISNEFYCEYENLKDHFRASHYLCEQDECASAQFTNAFRSDIDLKAHQATAHSKNAGKNAVRQMRTIDIDFNYGPRGGARGSRGGEGGRGGRPRMGDRGYIGGRMEDRSNDENVDGSGENSSYRNSNNYRPRDDRRERREKERLEVETAQLIAASLAEVQRQGQVSVIHPVLAEHSRAMQQQQQQQQQLESDTPVPPRPSLEHQTSMDFPTLGLTRPASAGSLNTTTTTSGNTGGLDSLANKVAYSAKHSVGGSLGEQDFPTLPGAGGSLPGRRRADIRKPVKTVWKVDTSQMAGTMPSSAPQNSSGRGDSAAGYQRNINSATNQRLVQKSRDDDFPGLPTNRAKSGTKTLSTLTSVKQSKNTTSENKNNGVGSSGNYSSIVDSNKSSVGAYNVEVKGSRGPEPVSNSSHSNVKANKSAAASSWSDGEDFPSLGKPSSNGSSAVRSAWGPSVVSDQYVNHRSDFSLAGASKRSKKEKKSGKERVVDVDSDEEVSYVPKSNGLGKFATLSDLANRLAGPQGIPVASDVKVSKEAVKDDSTPNQEPLSSKSNSKKKNKKPDGKDLQQEQARSEKMPKNKENISEKQVDQNKTQNKDKKTGASNQQSSVQDKVDNVANSLPVKVKAIDLPKEEQAGASKKQKKTKGKKDGDDKNSGSKDLAGSRTEVTSSVTTTSSSLVQLTESNGVVVEKTIATKTSVELNPVSSLQSDTVSSVTNSFTHAGVNFSAEDFPSLVPIKKASVPPGFSVKAPPPGFSTTIPCVPPASSVTKPPPGFSLPNSSSSDSLASMSVNVPRAYRAPKEAVVRNQLLIGSIKLAVGGDEEKFGVFRKCSGEFRRGEIAGEKYYSECLALIDPPLFNGIVVELLALLPDISKQQELLRVHQRYATEKRRDGGPAWSGSTDSNGLTTCQVCAQVLVPDDVLDHHSSHKFDCEYPAMGSGSSDFRVGKSVADSDRIGVQ